jgi:hypothetical protein
MIIISTITLAATAHIGSINVDLPDPKRGDNGANTVPTPEHHHHEAVDDEVLPHLGFTL